MTHGVVVSDRESDIGEFDGGCDCIIATEWYLVMIMRTN